MEWTECVIRNSKWVVPARYSNLSPLGQGAFGHVCLAYDNQINKHVAIKKLARPFVTNTHAKRVYREIKILKHISVEAHDNIIHLYDIFSRTDSAQNLDDIYLVTNSMTTNLRDVLRAIDLTENQINFFTYQILRGLKYLHTSNIIHRDLKPENLTISENWELRIIDFGLARSEKEEMTGYVVTRWYRAPEIMIKMMDYTKAVDIWSVGCILAEMYLRRPLFPGDQINQLNKVLEVVGFPSENFLRQVHEETRTFLKNIPTKPNRVRFAEYFHLINSPSAIDLIDKMLQLDPNERISCEQALKHPYLEKLHDPEDEPEGYHFDDHHEKQDYSINEWKSCVYNEIVTFVSPTNIDI